MQGVLKQNRDNEQQQIDAMEKSAGDLFASGLYCAESVLSAMAGAHGMTNDIIPRIATGFCGGVGRTSGMCGALAGGIMAIGLLNGRDCPEDKKERCYSKTHALVERFKQEFGSTQCSDILGCDISTKEGAARFTQNDLEARICAPVVARTAGMTAAVLSRIVS